ncbi:uncharacterized protein LOC111619613 [Centruroides sculpturatus]|uniref:uncharacterized protein LOC111619613 n=1 Tax=Centruroides sculpturatus TaxID=218467 RepID=UPI000C6CD17C|nr:uncharacterized protein LOC111619613 [Centruroides sculpturatus]
MLLALRLFQVNKQKMKSLLYMLISLTCLNIVYSKNATIEEICNETSKLIHFWQCLLPKLPSYYLDLYTEAVRCVQNIFKISDEISALVFLSCSDDFQGEEIIDCIIKIYKNKNAPSESDEREMDAAFSSCSEESRIFNN